MQPSLPQPRGPRSEAVIRVLREGPEHARHVALDVADPPDPLSDEDLQLALYLCYELHYRGFDGAHDDLEWDPELLAFRDHALERPFERALRAATGETGRGPEPAGAVTEALVSIAAHEGQPSLSRYLAREASLDQFREFVVHRSLYTLKEADPHSLVIARLEGPAKTALLEIQSDEYGGGRPERMHAAIFARTMGALELDPTYGSYLSNVPGATLATVNLVSLLSLHRRLRAAAMGHLAVFELTSSIANRRYGNGLRRLGFGPYATDYYDEHVEADAIHDMIATHDVAGQLVRENPLLAGEVRFGAMALELLEGRFASRLLGAWREGRSSLHAPLVPTSPSIREPVGPIAEGR